LTIVASTRGILAFVGKAFAIGAVMFAAWYALAQPISLASGWIAARVLVAAAPLDGARVSYADRQITFAAVADDRTARRNRLPPDALVEVPVNPLKYTFGIPFFLALILAGRPAHWQWKAAAGAAVILAIAAMGLFCEVYLDLSTVHNAWKEPFFLLPRALLEASALGFQLATLIFPSVMPVVLWAAFDPATLRVLLTAA
jgi:hypothetical protein